MPDQLQQLYLKQQTFYLSPGRAIYWEEQQALILSDLHIGKSGHFRKAGIPIPGQVQDGDLNRLGELVQQFDPKKIIIVGDMFHSHANRDLDKFQQWREARGDLQLILVKGNHDILKKEMYGQLGIELVQDGYLLNGFIFTHHPPGNQQQEGFTFSGHLHPGVVVHGAGRQRLRFPCFWYSANWMVLPAFSGFTGLYLVNPGAGESVVTIVENELVQF